MSKRYMTEADLLNVADDSCRHELVAGVIVAEPFPTPRHDRTFRRLLLLLGDFVDSHGLGEVFGETGFVLARNPDTVRGPDLSFVSRERLTNFDDARFFSGAPDPGWNDDDLNQLKAIPGTAFEVVDTGPTLR